MATKTQAVLEAARSAAITGRAYDVLRVTLDRDGYWIAPLLVGKPKPSNVMFTAEPPPAQCGPSRTRTLDPLIKSRSRKRTRKHSKEPPPENSGTSA
jgi:hypothetical protein